MSKQALIFLVFTCLIMIDPAATQAARNTDDKADAVQVAQKVAQKPGKKADKGPPLPPPTRPLTLDVDHMALTTKDLSATIRLFTHALGWRLEGKNNANTAAFVSNGSMFIALWQVREVDAALSEPVDRFGRLGMHHLAFEVESLETLFLIYERIKKMPEIKIGHPPVFNRGGPRTQMMLYDTSGIRIELVVPARSTTPEAIRRYMTAIGEPDHGHNDHHDHIEDK